MDRVTGGEGKRGWDKRVRRMAGGLKRARHGAPVFNGKITSGKMEIATHPFTETHNNFSVQNNRSLEESFFRL